MSRRHLEQVALHCQLAGDALNEAALRGFVGSNAGPLDLRGIREKKRVLTKPPARKPSSRKAWTSWLCSIAQL